jgi:hypothetical protein
MSRKKKRKHLHRRRPQRAAQRTRRSAPRRRVRRTRPAPPRPRPIPKLRDQLQARIATALAWASGFFTRSVAAAARLYPPVLKSIAAASSRVISWGHALRTWSEARRHAWRSRLAAAGLSLREFGAAQWRKIEPRLAAWIQAVWSGFRAGGRRTLALWALIWRTFQPWAAALARLVGVRAQVIGRRLRDLTAPLRQRLRARSAAAVNAVSGRLKLFSRWLLARLEPVWRALQPRTAALARALRAGLAAGRHWLAAHLQRVQQALQPRWEALARRVREAAEAAGRWLGPRLAPGLRAFQAAWAALVALASETGQAISRAAIQFAGRWWAPVLVAALVLLLVVPYGVRRPAVRPPAARHPAEAGRIFVLAYPEAVQGLQETPAGWVVLFRDGTQESYHDGLNLPFERRLDQADLASVLRQSYPFGRVTLPVPAGQEAGRMRNYALLREAYGATRREVESNLEVVDFLGNAVYFNRRNGAAAALRAVASDLAGDPEALAYLRPIAARRAGRVRSGAGAGLSLGRYISGWNWRIVAATHRLSPHSFGIALDIDNPFATRPKYWLWAQRQRAEILKDRAAIELVPWQVVEAFERHGFIWGGKWHHFDTMHFEYRPEFLAAEAQVRPGPEKLACHRPEEIGK